MGRSLEFLDSDTLDMIDDALEDAIAECKPSHDDTTELRLAVARHVLAAGAGMQDRERLRQSAVEYIRARFN